MKSLALRFLLPFGLVTIVFSAFVLDRAHRTSKRHVHELLNQQMTLAMEFNLAIRSYAAEQIRPAMEQLVGKDEFHVETMSTSFISRKIFERVRKNFPECIIRFASDDPRNPINKASPDEERVMDFFRAHPEAPPQVEEVQIQGQRYLALFTPRWMKPECLRCHGDPKDAPAAMLARYGETASFHRNVGEIMALDTVAVPLEKMSAALATETGWQSLILAAGLVLLGGAVMVVFRFVVGQRLAVMASHFHEIAAHPETDRLKPLSVTARDEIGLVGSAFNQMVEHLRRAQASLEDRVRQRTAELAQANQELRREVADRQRAEAALQRRADELAALNILGRTVNATLSLNQAATAGLEGMLSAVRPDLAFLFLQEGDRLVLKEVLPSEGRDRFGAIPERRGGECICELAEREGGPLYFRDIFQDPRCTWEECKKAGFKSLAALPMTSGGEVLGVIGLASERERDFERQGEFLETLASQVCIALANARLYEGMQQELAERKQAEDALRQSERKYRELVENANSIILRWTPQGEITFLNEYGQRFFGWRMEEILGRNVVGTIVPEVESSGRDLRELMKYICMNPAAFEQNLNENICRDGRRAWITWTNKTVFNDAGELTEVFSVGTDITGRKRAEEERDKLQAQLTQAQKMESVGRLAGGVAHDFNNMLQVILGNAALTLQDLPSDSPARENLKEIEKSACRSADLTRQLLAFARKQTIAPRVLDLNDTVAGMLKMLRRLIGEHIDLSWMPGANLWPVKMDPSQIDQILANLCVNARDAIAGAGTVTIETANVTLGSTDAQSHPDGVPGDYVLLAVSDTGQGMDADTRSHLFEPFFTTKEQGKGTGLGLATVFGIVKQNLGFISVYSEPGQGTAFKIYLPRAAEMAVAAAPAVKPIPRGTETVLLVEDETQILVMAQRILQQQGYTVLAAHTPEEALRLAAQHAGLIHLLITDVVMPGMNGRELRDCLADLKPGLRCLYMSGYTADVIAHHGVLDEGVQFLQKPFTIESLAEQVREALRQPDET